MQLANRVREAQTVCRNPDLKIVLDNLDQCGKYMQAASRVVGQKLVSLLHADGREPSDLRVHEKRADAPVH